MCVEIVREFCGSPVEIALKRGCRECVPRDTQIARLAGHHPVHQVQKLSRSASMGLHIDNIHTNTVSNGLENNDSHRYNREAIILKQNFLKII